MNSKAVIIVTSHADLGDTGRISGFWFNEMSAPYWALTDAGFDVDIASPKGGAAPFDPHGISDEEKSADTDRFLRSDVEQRKINATLAVHQLKAHDYAVTVFPCGFGTMWDLAQSEQVAAFVSAAYENGAILCAICHGQAGLIGAKKPDGTPLTKGMRLCCPPNSEEEANGVASIVPYLLETEFRKLGALFECGPDYSSKVVRDGRLITGQNGQSVDAAVRELLRAITELQPAPAMKS